MRKNAIGQRAREHGHTLLVLIGLQMRDLFGTDLTTWRLQQSADGTVCVQGLFSGGGGIRDLGTDPAVVALVRAENAFTARSVEDTVMKGFQPTQEGSIRCDFCQITVHLRDGAFFCAEVDPRTGDCVCVMYMCTACDQRKEQLLAEQE